MSIDSYFVKIDGRWQGVDVRDDLYPFWVDLCHGGPYLIDERYYFRKFEEALMFYQEGWQSRWFVDEEGKGIGLDHKELFSRGRLVLGNELYGPDPGEEGEEKEDRRRLEHESGGTRAKQRQKHTPEERDGDEMLGEQEKDLD